MSRRASARAGGAQAPRTSRRLERAVEVSAALRNLALALRRLLLTRSFARLLLCKVPVQAAVIVELFVGLFLRERIVGRSEDLLNDERVAALYLGRHTGKQAVGEQV